MTENFKNTYCLVDVQCLPIRCKTATLFLITFISFMISNNLSKCFLVVRRRQLDFFVPTSKQVLIEFKILKLKKIYNRKIINKILILEI